MGSAAGCFICLEGVEGAGKTTQAHLLADSLRTLGHEVVLAREPGSTPLGERVRETVLLDVTLVIPPRAELFLMLAARAAFVEQVVRSTLARGGCVIADRFELSTLAYQSAGRGLPLDEVLHCNRAATGGVAPDVTLLLDLDPADGRARQRADGKLADRMEREAPAFHASVAAAYRELARHVPGVVSVDARGTVAQVHERILARLRERIPALLRPRGAGPASNAAPSGTRA